MSRRGRKNTWDHLIELVARVPWPVGVGLAAATFIALDLFATTFTAPKPTDVSQLGAYAARQLYVSLATLLKYVLPIALLLGALLSFIKARRRGVLFARAAASPAAVVSSLTWQDFERLIHAHFERQDFVVRHTGGSGADGGVDLVLTKGNERTLVQCKQWRALKVGVSTVRELYGVMAAAGAAQGIVVTSGEFTPDALEFSRGRNIELLNGRALADLLQGADGSFRGPVNVAPESPTCPQCGAGMRRRTARRGSHAGQEFWGCERFPDCKGTRRCGA